MEQLLKERIQDYRSLSSYFVSLGFTDALYLPKRPIAKVFSNASWQQQEKAIENIITLRNHGWKGVDLKLHLDAATQVSLRRQFAIRRNAAQDVVQSCPD